MTDPIPSLSLPLTQRLARMLTADGDKKIFLHGKNKGWHNADELAVIFSIELAERERAIQELIKAAEEMIAEKDYHQISPRLRAAVKGLKP